MDRQILVEYQNLFFFQGFFFLFFFLSIVHTRDNLNPTKTTSIFNLNLSTALEMYFVTFHHC